MSVAAAAVPPCARCGTDGGRKTFGSSRPHRGSGVRFGYPEKDKLCFSCWQHHHRNPPEGGWPPPAPRKAQAVTPPAPRRGRPAAVPHDLPPLLRTGDRIPWDALSPAEFSRLMRDAIRHGRGRLLMDPWFSPAAVYGGKAEGDGEEDE